MLGTCGNCYFGIQYDEVPLKNEIDIDFDAIDENLKTYVVYDTSSYSYSKILDIITKSPNSKIHLGTYNDKSDVIITEEEIFKQIFPWSNVYTQETVTKSYIINTPSPKILHIGTHGSYKTFDSCDLKGNVQKKAKPKYYRFQSRTVFLYLTKRVWR